MVGHVLIKRQVIFATARMVTRARTAKFQIHVGVIHAEIMELVSEIHKMDTTVIADPNLLVSTATCPSTAVVIHVAIMVHALIFKIGTDVIVYHNLQDITAKMHSIVTVIHVKIMEPALSPLLDTHVTAHPSLQEEIVIHISTATIHLAETEGHV